MNEFLPLFMALIWPVTIFVLLIIFRRPIAAIIKILENRLQQGDKLSAFGVSIEPVDPKLGLPSVSTPSKEKDLSIPEASLIVTGTDKTKSLLVAIGETSAASGFEISGLIGIGDTLAMAAVNSMFLGHGEISIQTSVIRSRYARIGQLLELNPNIISIGGPSGNNLSRMIMTTNPFTLGFEGMAVVDQRSRQTYDSVLSKDYLTGRDWGILLSIPNPSRNGRILVLAGIYGYGTYGAGVLLSKINKYPSLMDMASKSSFEALVEVSFTEGVIKETNLIFARELE